MIPRTGEVRLTRMDTEHCPECKGLIVRQEGCALCPSCGYTKC